MPLFKIQHITKYEYEKPVTESVNEIRIFPYQSVSQEILQHDLIITDQPEVHVFNDYWGNKTGIFSIINAHRLLVIESKLLVRTTLPTELQVNFDSSFEELQNEVNGKLLLLELSRPDFINKQSVLNSIAKEVYSPGDSVAGVVGKSCGYIFENFQYIKGITTIETTVEEILETRAGVCQDFAHVLLQLLRSIQIPCRYVSGYICPNKNGMRGEGATHAWVEAWVPGFGWAGIDPTNNVWVTNTHVKLAVGRNFTDCSPIKGTFRGPARQDLFVWVSVEYENGQSFEETTRVRMDREAADEVALMDESFAAQQQ
ncbi:MAG: transglutaminase family protein [Chitinophagaceae bacterium]|nr:transglutaminase family protein [Chitinophagaceae bacterium]